MVPNSIPELLHRLRPKLSAIAARVGVSHALANAWREEKSQPRPDKRKVLVRAVQKHAAELLTLAQKVEREGATRTVGARSGPRGRTGRRAGVFTPVRRSAAGRSTPRTRARRRGGAE